MGWLAVVLLVPLNLTILALCLAFWVGLWGAANLGLGVRGENLHAVGRGVTGVSHAAGIIGATASAWGTTSAVGLPSSGLGAAGEQLSQLAGIGQSAGPAIPVAMGADEPKYYLLALLNDGELFGSGGAPLDLALVEAAGGRPRIVDSGSTSDKFNPGNVGYPWPRKGGLPWYRPDRQYPLANSNFHPDFTFSGPNLMSAWANLPQQPVSGVVTLDVNAIAAMLRRVGPIEVPGYGTLTADNIVGRVLVDAYRDFSDDADPEAALAARRARNDELRKALIRTISGPRAALEAVRGLWPAIASRHVQLYMADPQVAPLVTAIGAQGALMTNPGDIVGVFMQSAPSKVAVFQERSIRHSVVVYPDGSAAVSQETSFSNAVPDDLPGQRQEWAGYLALVLRQRVALRIPATATDAVVEVTQGKALDPAFKGPYPDEVGGAVMWQGQEIPPGATSVTTLSYRLPPGTFTDGNRLRYQVTCNPQAMTLPVALRIDVRFEGGQPVESPGWQVSGDRARWRGSLDQILVLSVSGPDAG